jgi:hypothetical protein
MDEAARRWPGFAAGVRAVGAFRSVHAPPLRLRKESIGALNLFHSRPGPFPEADLALGQAKGVIAERVGLPMYVAFDRLRRYARSSNQKLSDVARRLVERDLDPELMVSRHSLPGRPPVATGAPTRLPARGHHQRRALICTCREAPVP